MTDPVSTGNNNASTLSGALPSGKNLTIAAVLAALLGAGGFGGVYTYISTLGTWPNGQFRALDTALILGQPPAKVATSGNYSDLINTPNFSSFFNTPAPAGQFSTGYTGGVPSFAQVAFSDLAGTATPAQAPFAIQRSGDNFGAGALKFPAPPAAPDLTYAASPMADFIGIAKGGMISYTPILSSIYGPSDGSVVPSFFDHQRGSLVISHVTNDDAHSEEQTLGVETIDVTGYTKPYAANTTFNVGDNTQVGNATYRACPNPAPSYCPAGYTTTSAGTTGANSAPPGTRPTAAQTGNYQVTDGTITWQWVNDAAIGAKVGIYDELTANGAQAGPWWGMAVNTQFGPGSTPLFGANLELDMSNNSGKNCVLGSCQAYGIFMQLAGAQQTAGVYMAGNSTTNYNEYYGILLAGTKLASVADLEANGSGQIGVGICADGIATCAHSNADIQIGYSTTMPSMGPAAISILGPHSSASISDASTAPSTLAMSGTKSNAAIFDTSTTPVGHYFGGTYSKYQAQGAGWDVTPTGEGDFTGAVFGQSSAGGSTGYASVFNNNSGLNGALKFVDGASGGQSYAVGPGSGTGTTDFNIYNLTTNTLLFGLTKNGNLKIPASVTSPTYQETLATPASSSAACTTGQFGDDANYHYVCVATNTWKRVALSAF